MGVADELNALVEGAYAAALDDSLWTPWSGDLIAALGGFGGSFHVIDQASGPIQAAFHTKLASIDEYLNSGVAELDPQIPVVMQLERPTIYLDTDHLRRDDPLTAEYRAWLVERCEFDHHMTAVSLLGDGKQRAAVSIHRKPADGHTPTDEQRKLAAIFPEIERAMQLGFRHAEKLAESYWNGLAATVGEPALLLDERGQVSRMSDAMLALLSTADGLDVSAGRLTAQHPAADADLMAVIARAVADASPCAGAVRVARPSGRRPLVLTVYPLPRRYRMLAPAEAAALMTVVDPAESAAGTTHLYREAFGLTRREADLAVLLLAGHSVESAAATLEMALATARTHLRGLMAKAGVTRQAELVGLLSRIG